MVSTQHVYLLEISLMLLVDNLSESTASGEYASQRLHTAGPGGSAKGPSSRQVVLASRDVTGNSQARGRPFGSCRPERLICSRRRRYIPATVPPVSNM